MPPPKKIDLLPEELRGWLIDELKARGFAEIVEVTEALNFRLQEEGLSLSIGKSAVGDLNKALKEQREAFEIADALMADMDIQAEGQVQQALVQMISASAMQAIMKARGEDEPMTADQHAKFAKMLKDLMSSSSTREKLLEGERERVAKEAREAAHAEVEQALAETAAEEGLSSDLLKTLRNNILGLKT